MENTSEKPYGIIYKATNLINGKVYIGQTVKSLQQRRTTHYEKAKQKINTHFYDALNAYSPNIFLWEVIEYCYNKNDLNIREIFWISYYNSLDKDKGYNMTIGGTGGDIMRGKTPEQIASWRLNLSKAGKGRKHKPMSEEQKRYYSKLYTGRKASKESREKQSKSLLESYRKRRDKGIPSKISKLWRLTKPDGTSEIIIGNILKYCKEHNLILNTLRRNINNFVQNGKNKGYKLEKLY